MPTDVYRVGRPSPRSSHRRRLWIFFGLGVLGLIFLGIVLLSQLLHPKTSIHQARAVATQISYGDTARRHYDEPNFGVDLPSVWQALAAIPGPYKRYDWQLQSKATSQDITVYEDTIPTNFAVNRVVIVQAQTDHLSVQGSASDNCSAYTKTAPNNTYQGGAPAKWQGIDFLCDQNNPERDVLGTSSHDGVNMVLLKSPTTTRTHRYFFSYTDHTLNPDYSVFYDFLNSFKLK